MGDRFEFTIPHRNMDALSDLSVGPMDRHYGDERVFTERRKGDVVLSKEEVEKVRDALLNARNYASTHHLWDRNEEMDWQAAWALVKKQLPEIDTSAREDKT